MFHFNCVENERLTFNVQKPAAALIQTQNYPFLLKYLDSFSWPSPFKRVENTHSS